MARLYEQEVRLGSSFHSARFDASGTMRQAYPLRGPNCACRRCGRAPTEAASETVGLRKRRPAAIGRDAPAVNSTRTAEIAAQLPLRRGKLTASIQWRLTGNCTASRAALEKNRQWWVVADRGHRRTAACHPLRSIAVSEPYR